MSRSTRAERVRAAQLVLEERAHVDEGGRLADRVVLDDVAGVVLAGGEVAGPLAPLHLRVEGRGPRVEGGPDRHVTCSSAGAPALGRVLAPVSPPLCRKRVQCGWRRRPHDGRRPTPRGWDRARILADARPASRMRGGCARRAVRCRPQPRRSRSDVHPTAPVTGSGVRSTRSDGGASTVQVPQGIATRASDSIGSPTAARTARPADGRASARASASYARTGTPIRTKSSGLRVTTVAPKDHATPAMSASPSVRGLVLPPRPARLASPARRRRDPWPRTRAPGSWLRSPASSSSVPREQASATTASQV